MRYLALVLSSILLVHTHHAHASESYLRYGIGIAESAQLSVSEVKLLGAGYMDSLTEVSQLSSLVYQLEGGFWIDTQTQTNRKSSAYGSAAIGLNIQAGPFKASSVHGPGLISTPDAYLGSIPQFFHDLSVGLEDDKTRAGMCLSYKHISNAGLWPPNAGRDFLTFRLSLPF
jgi:hypothetical protein